jgi:hypothetical protein
MNTHAAMPPVVQRMHGIWYLELTGTFNQAIAKFGEAVWTARGLIDGASQQVLQDRILVGRLRAELRDAIDADPGRKDLRELLLLVKNLHDAQIVDVAELLRLLEMKMTADVKKALEIAQNMDPEQRTLRPEWAAGALVILNPGDLEALRPHIENMALSWEAPRRGINRVFVSDEFKPWVHTVITTKRHVENRGHQEGKHKCVVNEKLTKIVVPDGSRGVLEYSPRDLLELLPRDVPIAPPSAAAPLHGSVAENAFRLSLDFAFRPSVPMPQFDLYQYLDSSVTGLDLH